MDTHALPIPYLYEIVVFLLSSVVIVPLVRYFHASPILGFLFAGVLIGPYGLAVVRDVDGVRALGELGVTFLLFMIGLELSIERLRSMRRLVFGLGLLQMVLSSIAIGAAAYLYSRSFEGSVAAGLSASLSSTAIVMQCLIERSEFSRRFGRTTFAVLLFQDLAVVPILALGAVVGQGGGTALALRMLGQGAAAVAIILVVGRYVLRPVYRTVAGARSPEVFMAMTLLTILVIGSATALAGLSMALGAFLAGLVLAETEYRMQIETDIEPFRGLLLGLFFISIGMSIDMRTMFAQTGLIFTGLVGLIVIKAGIVAALCVLFGLSRGVALRAGLALAGGGEFAFVATQLAVSNGVMPLEGGQRIFIIISLSMALTPVLIALGARLERYLDQKVAEGMTDPADFAGKLDGHVIIAGFGRVGQLVAKLLEANGSTYVAIDLEARRVTKLFREGVPIWFGDASRIDVLDRCGAGRASLAVVTFNDIQSTSRAVRALRADFPQLPVLARARDTHHARELEALGTSFVVPETLEASLQIAAHVLTALGTSRQTVEQLIDSIRIEHYAGVLELAEDGGRDKDAKALAYVHK